MPIRRILKNLRARDYSLVALELFVVIVGVFLGIQVSNWNEDRIDRSRALSYLERIHADLSADIANYEDRRILWQRVSEYGERGLRYAKTRDLDGLTEWDVLLAYFQASQLAEFYTTYTTFEELKSRGELGLLGDLALRNSLAYYYTNAANPVMTERPTYRMHVRGMIPMHVQNYIWESCYGADAQNQEFLDCESPVEAQEAAEIIDAISANDQLMSELTYWMSTMKIAGLIGRTRAEAARKIRDSISEKIDSD